MTSRSPVQELRPPGAHRLPGRTVLAVALVGVLALLSIACTKTTDNTDSTGGTVAVDDGPPTAGGSLVMAVTSETNGWNPGLAQWADAGHFVAGSVIETLMTFDPDGNTVDWLTEKVEPSTPGDFTKWKVKVKPNIMFHDGTTLDAKAVKMNLDVYRGTYYTDALALSSIVLKDLYRDVVVTDPLTVEVTLSRPWSAFPANLAGQSGYMMAPSMIDAADKGMAHPVGTGPFVFENWVPDNSFRVRRNLNYWKKDAQGNPLPYLESITFKPMPDSKQRMQALQTGDIDMLMTTRAEDAVEAEGEFTVAKDYNSEKTLVMMNTDPAAGKGNNPLSNIHARRAVAYATDHEAIQRIVGGEAELGFTTAPQVSASKWGMDNSQTDALPYDPDKARQELEQYRSDTGNQDLSFQFFGVVNVEDQMIMQALQQQWADLGITANIETVEQQKFITQVTMGGFQASMFRNFAYIDPDSDDVFLNSRTARGIGNLSVNFYQYKNADNDRALTTGSESGDFAVRKKAYEESTRNINQAALNVWLFNTPYALIARPNIRGLERAAHQPFGNFQAKPWFWPEIWKKQ